MSYDTSSSYFWKINGQKLHLLQLRKNSLLSPDVNGRIEADDTELIYPDEQIDVGLRVEYNSYVKPFVDVDPNTLATDTNETTWTNPTLAEVTSPEETSHVNLNRMLSLACVCFVQAQDAAKQGNIQLKEYYMREFYKKLADNESNKKKITIAFASPVSSVR
ncbi:MAG TPA: hypothetical protein EYQ21_00815 [Flavobacteriales bacterium]|jgi:hypothetical protein|nr:hypothetical protein [Flavobacteriales bacterium]